MDPREAIRPQYKPERVKVLFVGDSLAASGTFFYNADSNLYEYTQKAFSAVYGPKCGEGQQFLQFFKGLGCYFDDLCDEPVNRMNRVDRRAKRREGISNLASRMKNMQPMAVVALMRGIESHVRAAIKQADLSAPFYSVPFPAYNDRNRSAYVSELSEILRTLIRTKII